MSSTLHGGRTAVSCCRALSHHGVSLTFRIRCRQRWTLPIRLGSSLRAWSCDHFHCSLQARRTGTCRSTFRSAIWVTNCQTDQSCYRRRGGCGKPAASSPSNNFTCTVLRHLTSVYIAYTDVDCLMTSYRIDIPCEASSIRSYVISQSIFGAFLHSLGVGFSVFAAFHSYCVKLHLRDGRRTEFRSVHPSVRSSLCPLCLSGASILWGGTKRDAS